MPLILDNINKIISLNETETSLLLSKLETIAVKAKTIIIKPGDISHHSYFVNKGVVRSFTISDNITEHVMHFACEGWWIGDMYSLLTQKPGNLFIEVLEDAELLLLSKENQEMLYEAIPKLERFFRILTENSLVAHQERLMDNLSLSAVARFDKFCQKYPDLIHRVPQKHIASFIGVTPEFFSKLKNRYWKK